MDQPFPPSTTSTPQESPSQSHAIWIAALALPLVIVVSGAFVAFLCWRRLRLDPHASSSRWKRLDETPPSSSEHAHDPVPRLPPTQPFPRPLVLLARTSSAPPVVPHSLPQMIQRPRPPSSNFSFPSVSTKVTSNGNRVITKKRPTSTWPPPISWPLELETFHPQTDTTGGGGGGGPDRDGVNESNGADLHRGLSLVSGYQSQSNHPSGLHQQLVEEAKGTRNSWTEGDDELDQHFSTVPNAEHQHRSSVRPRARSLSSRSISEYSHLTMGATTLGNLIDQEVARVAAHAQAQQARDDFDSTSLRSTVPSVLPARPTRPLNLSRPRRASSSSADLYSLRPISFVPFPRLPPLVPFSSSSSRPDLPTTPSTFDYHVSTIGEQGPHGIDEPFKLPPPLPYDDLEEQRSRRVDPLPLAAWWKLPETTDSSLRHFGSDAERVAREAEEGGGRVESLIAWRRDNSHARKKERDLAIQDGEN